MSYKYYCEKCKCEIKRACIYCKEEKAEWLFLARNKISFTGICKQCHARKVKEARHKKLKINNGVGK